MKIRPLIRKRKIYWILGALFAVAGAIAGSVRAQPELPTPETLVKPTIEAIKKGRETVKGAWEKGELDENSTLVALGSREVVSVGLALPSGDIKLADELTQELLERHPEVLKKADALPERALIYLANWLGERGDSRCVALYEVVLAAKPARAPIWDGGVDASLYRLSGFYQRQGQIEKALQTVERIAEYSSDPAMLANFNIHKARLNEQLGRQGKAIELYAEVEERGDQRSVGVTRMDRANKLFRAGQKEAARALLLTPIPGPAHPPIEIALLARLAESYFADDDLETAQKHLTQALSQLKTLPEPLGDPYLKGFGPAAKRLAAQIEKIQHSPFYWAKSDKIWFYVLPQSEGEVKRVILRFKTPPMGLVSFRCDHPALRIEPAMPAPAGQDDSLRVVFLSIVPGLVKENTDMVLIAGATDFPGEEARLTISVTVPVPHTPR